MKGRINAYDCPECGKATVTIDVDEGTTAFMIGCKSTPGCRGEASSRFYDASCQTMTPEWEWYAPTAEQARKEGPAMAEHARMGGLFIRRKQMGGRP